VKDTERDWFRSIPWEAVLGINQSFCDTQQTPFQFRDAACQAARQIWENASRLSLPDALDVCKRCYDLGPFVFNNGNTFAAAARKLMEDWLQLLPPVEAQIARTSVGHYVVGQITRKEMVSVLTHFVAHWPIAPVQQPVVVALPPIQVQPQARVS
jgi:hypothetical protein